ncbi:MAG: recombinase family protein [Clostridia bacterium]|nr:recombinase family protein [Clostridia bacterium]
MDKCRIAIYDCYVPLNDEVKKLHIDKLEDMKKEIGQYPEYRIVAEFSDECSATTPLLERPGYQKVMWLVDTCKVDMIVSISMKNFSRNLEDTLSALQTFKDKGVTLKCPSDNFDSGHIEMVEDLNFIKNYGMEFDDEIEEEQEPDGGMVMQ